MPYLDHQEAAELPFIPVPFAKFFSLEGQMPSVRSLSSVFAGLAIGFGVIPVGFAQAQDTPIPSATTKAADPKEAVVDRAPLVLRDPTSYQVPLHLAPFREITLASPLDTTVTSILMKLGDQAASQAEVLRLDTKLLQLAVTRAQAALRAAEAEVAAVTGPAKEAAEARVQVAKADFDIAELRVQQASIKAPFAGRVVKLHVAEGEYVRAGQALATIIDSSQLVAELPVDRRAQKAGDNVAVKIEDQPAQMKLATVLPLTPEMDKIRELFLAVGTGRATIDNASGKFQAGQTVYSPLIPRFPVVEVSTATLANGDDGSRKVQVVRDGIVRDIKVQTLGQIGDDRIFISGDFGPKDELIVKSSIPLVDGNRLTPRGGVAAGTVARSPGTTPAAAPSAAPPNSALPPGATTPTSKPKTNF
ncbi:Multidrug resistance protein MdtN [Planctomyces sp. SH-PL14]|nr:Multidrug resistance protein MdtN [Planctomyces sp. SH-PL14]